MKAYLSKRSVRYRRDSTTELKNKLLLPLEASPKRFDVFDEDQVKVRVKPTTTIGAGVKFPVGQMLEMEVDATTAGAGTLEMVSQVSVFCLR